MFFALGSADGWQFRTQTLHPGDNALYTFDEKGAYEYDCEFYGEDMCGVIPVGDASYLIRFPMNDLK